jgi:hypothetical protein
MNNITTCILFLHVGFHVAVVFDRSLVSTSVSTAAVVATAATWVVAMCVAARVVVVVVEVVSVFVAHIVLVIVAHLVVMLVAAVIGVAAWFVTAALLLVATSASSVSTVTSITTIGTTTTTSVTTVSLIGSSLCIVEGCSLNVLHHQLVAHGHCIAASHEGKE